MEWFVVVIRRCHFKSLHQILGSVACYQLDLRVNRVGLVIKLSPVDFKDFIGHVLFREYIPFDVDYRLFIERVPRNLTNCFHQTYAITDTPIQWRCAVVIVEIVHVVIVSPAQDRQPI